jgi:hypothetical protein
MKSKLVASFVAMFLIAASTAFSVQPAESARAAGVQLCAAQGKAITFGIPAINGPKHPKDGTQPGCTTGCDWCSGILDACLRTCQAPGPPSPVCEYDCYYNYNQCTATCSTECIY